MADARPPDAPGAVDAGPPDGPPACMNQTCADGCCSTQARECLVDGGVCECPTLTIASPFMPLIEQMDLTTQAPAVLGIGAFSSGDRLHAVVVAFDATATPLDTDLDLAASVLGEAPFVGLGWDVDVVSMTTRAAYTSASGTLRLTRRCEAGVAGVMTNVMLLENTSATDPTPPPGACALTIPDLAFDLGGPCP